MQEDNKIVEIETFEELKELKLAIIAEAQQHVQPTDWKEGSDKFKELRRRWNELSDNAKIVIEEEDTKLNEKFNKICNTFYENREKHYAEIEQEKINNAKRKSELIDELKQIIYDGKSIDSIQRVKKIQEEFREIGPAPTGENEKLQKSFQALLDQIYAEVKLYYDLKELDRRKNYEEKLSLCEQAEALMQEKDTKIAIQRVRILYDTWKEIGPVPHEHNAAIWERFKKATDAINARYDEYLQSLQQEYQQNLAKKESLCQQIHSFVESINVQDRNIHWKEYQSKIEDFEREWESIGHVPKEQSDDIRKKYKNLINLFYAKQKEFFKLRQQEKENAIQQKMALIEAVESLKDSTEWESVTDLVKKYQEDWKNTAFLNEKESRPLWERFKAACDHFFDRRKKHYEELEKERTKNLEEKERICAEIESFVEQEPNEENTNKVKEYQKLWKTLGDVPLRYKNKIWNRFNAACDNYFDHLRRFNKKALKDKKKEKRQSNTNETLDEAKINKKLKALQQERDQLENNLSFFAKGKSGDSLRSSVQAQIDKLNKEIEQLKAELKAIRIAKKEAEKAASDTQMSEETENKVDKN
ncbi:MAG: DUF349 domain-containing protein [Bacteroidia bacterium]|nr:DUF349 domain-containing protein [Bacteroidia bacterium]MDW8347938.1 DUF349 domain-containing protein [Bacteroidia bacterium]